MRSLFLALSLMLAPLEVMAADATATAPAPAVAENSTRQTRSRLLAAISAGSPGARVPTDPAPMLDRLRSLEQETGFLGTLEPSRARGVGYYNQTHGWPDDDLTLLLFGRFAYTGALTAELQATDPATDRYWAIELWTLLARVADPASIPFLQRQLDGPRRQELAQHWLPEFQQDFLWIESPELWSAFFDDWFVRETDPAIRTAILHHLYVLDDPRVTARFSALAANPATTGTDLLIALAGLTARGVPQKTESLQSLLAQLPTTRSELLPLKRYLIALRHEALVPWLVPHFMAKVGHADVIPNLRRSNVRWHHLSDIADGTQPILEALTLRTSISGKPAWEQWSRERAGESREVWLRQAASLLLPTPRARSAENSSILLPPDAGLIGAVEGFNGVSSGGALQWLAATYRAQPFLPGLREEIRQAARRLTARQPGVLTVPSGRARRGEDLDALRLLLNMSPPTWAQAMAPIYTY